MAAQGILMKNNLESARPYTSMEIVADLQTEIKMLIKNSIFRLGDMLKYTKRVEALLDEGLKEITNEGLRNTIRVSLVKFSQEQFNNLVNVFNFGQLPLIVAFTKSAELLDLKGLQTQINGKIANLKVRQIENAFSNLANSQPKVNNRQPLYSYAETYERYNENQAMVSDLKQKTNLVICGTHSNCSDRCFKWQGRVYSLDGTYGKTNDGREYVPLEVATQARDKYGNVNGLLGYNCRHKLVEYRDGVSSPKVTKSEQKRQYNINNEQRLYERKIRAYKEKAELSILDKSKYKKKATELAKEYKEFCQKNNVVEYRSRLKI